MGTGASAGVTAAAEAASLDEITTVLQGLNADSFLKLQQALSNPLAQSSSANPGTQCAVLVSVEIKEDRIDDFLKAMEEDVTKSRDISLDPGCLRFDLLRDRDAANKFIFYEAYIDDAAHAHHKTTLHYKSWADFKASGGVESQTAAKIETASIPGDWAFQSTGKSAAATASQSTALVTVEVKPDRLDDFFKVMENDARCSRDTALDPGCLRFDLLRDRDDPNKFVFYEVFKDDEAAAFHKTTEHYKAWAAFKASGGIVSQTAVKVASDSIPGGWALQESASGGKADVGPDGQVFFIAGFPSSGKTFMGDYLASRGWEHVDGDLIANPEAKAMGSEAKVTAFWAAMQKVFKGGIAEREEWMPYYELLIELTKKARQKKTDVVLSYAVLGIFGGERELFKQHFPNMKFINVKVPHAELIERFWKRHEKMKAEAGFTDQQYWDYHEMDEARAEYGPVFSKESMTKFMEKTVYNPRLIDMPLSEPDCFEIDNEDTEAWTAFRQLNKIANLEWKGPVDNEAIAQINYERYKNM